MGEEAAFLSRYPPFRTLDAGRLEAVVAGLRTQSYPAGATILKQSGDPAGSLFVIREGIVDLLDQDRVIDHLGKGELFGISAFSGMGPALSVRARTPAVCYLIDPDLAREVMGSQTGLAYLTAAVARWREQAPPEEHTRPSDSGAHMTAEIRAASDVEALVATMRTLPSSVGAMLAAHDDPIDVGRMIGRSIDELTVRLIELHLAQVGNSATTFSWLALGSAARHEQALRTDQDHAIAFDAADGDEAAVEPYLAGLADFVTAGMEACGIARCEGNVMASNPALRRTVPGWRERFGVYMSDPGIMGSHLTGIMFDYRRVTGTVEAEVALDEMIRGAHRDRAFMKRLGTAAVEVRPPTGRRHAIDVKHGEHPGRLDIKHGAITPITNLARFFAIEAGLTENHTVARLRAAAAADRITDQLRDDLEEAFRLSWRIRLEHHVLQAEAGDALDDLVVPESLRPIPLRSLGEALRVVGDAQSDLARELALY